MLLNQQTGAQITNCIKKKPIGQYSTVVRATQTQDPESLGLYTKLPTHLLWSNRTWVPIFFFNRKTIPPIYWYMRWLLHDTGDDYFRLHCICKCLAQGLALERSPITAEWAKGQLDWKRKLSKAGPWGRFLEIGNRMEKLLPHITFWNNFGFYIGCSKKQTNKQKLVLN